MPTKKKLKGLRHNATMSSIYGRLANPFKAFRKRRLDSEYKEANESNGHNDVQSNIDKEDSMHVDDESFDIELTIFGEELIKYSKTMVGGEKVLKDAKEVARCFSCFVNFCFGKNEEWKQLPLDNVLRQIVHNHYPLVGEYLEQSFKYLKSGTILNILNSILMSLRWFHYHCELNNHRCDGNIDGFEHYIKRLRKAYNRALKKEKLKSKSHEELVAEGRWPIGGLRELYEHTRKRLKWVMSLEKEDFREKKVYNDFTDWLYSVFWVGMIQGRKSGLEDMKYSQRHGLIDPNGHENSTNFKTALTYNVQAISSHQAFSIGMRIYLDKARIQVAGDEMYAGDAPLFLTFSGIREYKSGTKVTTFFRKQANLHITTTAIRGMYDTETDDLASRNIITKKQQDSVLWLNGHSRATSRQHYLKKKKNDAVMDGRHVMDIILNGGVDRECAFNGGRGGKTNDVSMDDWNNVDKRASSNDDDDDDGDNDFYDPFEYEEDDHEQNDMFVYDDGRMSNYSITSDDDMHGERRERFKSIGGENRHDQWSHNQDQDSYKSSQAHRDSYLQRRMEGGPLRAFDEVASTSASKTRRRSMSNVHEYSDDAEEETLRPLPLSLNRYERETYVKWTDDEIQYTQKAYDFIYPQLPPEQKRFVSKEILKHIRNDAYARSIFHPCHIESAGKFRHVLRKYILK
jgi:hypothetical protein